FYGFFKQAKEGPCNEPKPGFWDVVKKAKWEAWSCLGSISKIEAMESYVKELKQVMKTMPDTEEMADFSIVLKTFYEAVYEPTGEEPPHILHIFKKPVSDDISFNVDKCNGYSGDETVSSQFDLSNQEEENKNILEEQERNSNIHLNGIYSNGNGDSTNGSDQEEDNDIVVVVANNDTDIDNMTHILQDTSLSRDLELKPGLASEHLYIVEVSTQKKGLPMDKKDSKDGNNVPSLQPGFSSTNGKDKCDELSSASDDSDEEFCDSLDPEHLSTIENEMLNTSNADTLNGSPSNSNSHNSSTSTNTGSSPDHLPGSSLSDSDASDVESLLKAQRFTSTPFEKKSAHVTFNTDDKPSNKKAQSPGIANHQNGGILKVKQAGSGYGGGDAKRPTRQGMRGGFSHSQSRQQAISLQGGGEISSTQMTPSGATGHSDSDSDDTNHNSCDSSGERDEINERIITALERIQQDMNRVLRRLETMEDVMALRQERLHTVSRFDSREQGPWWSQFIPSKTVAFLILWPFIINLIFYYSRKKKV
ncbi:hypothetical protein QZH41_014108, partial [Actinostola sp. cb2023]